MPFGKSKRPLPTRSLRSVRAAVRSTSLHSACIMPIPLLQLKIKDQSHAEKQRVWSRSCHPQDLLRTIDCDCVQDLDIDCALSCDM